MARKTRYAVLGVLTIEPASGYDIRKFLESSVSHFWAESFGQIYPILHELLAQGRVTSEEQPAGGRSRTVYSITDSGHKELGEWLRSADFEIKNDRNELLLKIFFADRNTLPVVLDQVRSFRRQLEIDLATYREIGNELATTLSTEWGYQNWVATLRFGQIAAQAQLEWCDETLDRLSM